jgi:Na+/melibiose symporter-like transporter
LPFLCIMFITLMIITYVPTISLTMLDKDKTSTGFLLILAIVAIFILSALALIFFEKKIKVDKPDLIEPVPPVAIED